MASKSQIDISHNENEMAKTEDNIITEQSRLSVQDAKAISLRQSFKVYPKAVMWSVFLSTALIMEGYDVVSVSGPHAMRCCWSGRRRSCTHVTLSSDQQFLRTEQLPGSIRCLGRSGWQSHSYQLASCTQQRCKHRPGQSRPTRNCAPIVRVS